VSEGTGAYCKGGARPVCNRIWHVCVRGGRSEPESRPTLEWLCRQGDRRPGLRMPTPRPNPTALPAIPRNQKPGCVVPFMKVVGVYSLSPVPCSLRQGNNIKPLVKLLPRLARSIQPATLALAARGFSCYSASRCWDEECSRSVSPHHARGGDLRKGQSLGKHDDGVWKETAKLAAAPVTCWPGGIARSCNYRCGF